MMSSFTLEIVVQRREPYAVHFESGKKHVIVLSYVYMTIYTMLNKIRGVIQKYAEKCYIFFVNLAIPLMLTESDL